jgi:hypothetical protein
MTTGQCYYAYVLASSQEDDDLPRISEFVPQCRIFTGSGSESIKLECVDLRREDDKQQCQVKVGHA